MSDQTNSEDESSKKIIELSNRWEHNLEDFARKSLLNNDYVASYLIGFLGEGDLRLLQEKEYLQNIMNGMVSMKWQVLHGIDFEISYSKLYDTNPTTQEEFDALLKTLLEGR
jgi:hypothetical protein